MLKHSKRERNKSQEEFYSVYQNVVQNQESQNESNSINESKKGVNSRRHPHSQQDAVRKYIHIPNRSMVPDLKLAEFRKQGAYSRQKKISSTS